jgi:hypothetical protein
MGAVIRSRSRALARDSVLSFASSTTGNGVPLLTVTKLATGQQAVLTVGARSVAVQKQTRTFREAKRVGAEWKEDFGRTRTSGWGMSPYYGTWSNNAGGSLTDYTADGSVGKIFPLTNNVSHYQTLRDDVTDPDVFIRTRVSTSPAGAANSITLLSSYSTTSEHDRARVTYNTTGALTATLAKVVAGSETQLSTQTSVVTGYVGGDWIKVRKRRVGGDLAMWLWRDSDPVPETPTITANDSTHTAGRVGLRAFNSTGVSNSPVYEIDELHLTAGSWTQSPQITHNWWRHLLRRPFTSWTPEVEAQVRLMFASDDLDALAYSMAFITGACDVYDARLGPDRRVMGMSSYGTTLTDGTREEGADFNDFMRRSWPYPALTVPTTDINELAQQNKLDCSGAHRMIWGYWMGLPMCEADAQDFNGINLPRRAVGMSNFGPGVVIADAVDAQLTDLDDVLPGDSVFFNADAADDEAGEDAGDAVENDDHVGMVMGTDDVTGEVLMASGRKVSNAYTFGRTGGSASITGSGFWAKATRRVRRY